MWKSALLKAAGLAGRPAESDAYRLEVQNAWQQWQSAQRLFNTVSDPELVDVAIYDVEATRRRYIYMLHKWEELKNKETAAQ